MLRQAAPRAWMAKKEDSSIDFGKELKYSPLDSHDQTAGLRGQKADIWDGGHRVPFIVRWPRKIQAGSICNEIAELTNFMATCVDLLDITLPDDVAEDSFSILPAMLMEKSVKPSRRINISHSVHGVFFIRKGRWKYMEHYPVDTLRFFSLASMANL